MKGDKESEINDDRLVRMGNRLREIRIDKGYTSYEFFAWENKIPRVQYYKMEKGGNFTMKSLLRVLDAFEITPDEFFKDLK